LNLTHFNRSFFERLIDNEARYEALKFEIRSHKILIEFISKSFYEEKLKKFRIEDDNIYFKDVNNRSPLARIMKRIFFFDLIYLKELKDQVFASDFDEVRFTYNLIMDVTRLMSENESKFT
jgi:superfamily I DNA and/or RNA helicase